MDKARTTAVVETQMVNEMRLNARQWALAAGIILLLISSDAAGLWKGVERFDTGPDYRIPYDLSKDYWLYAPTAGGQDRSRQHRDAGRLGGLGRIRSAGRDLVALSE